MEAEDATRVRSVAERLLSVRRWSENNLKLGNSTIPWDVLLLTASGEKGSLPYSDLAKDVGRSPRAVQYVLRDLERAGFIELNKSEHDRRCIVVSITDKGKVKLEELADFVEQLFEPLLNSTVSSGSRHEFVSNGPNPAT